MSAAVAVAVMCTSVRTPCAIEETTHAGGYNSQHIGMAKDSSEEHKAGDYVERA
jgi:hypothetical protein